jgi:hypothetical protein
MSSSGTFPLVHMSLRVPSGFAAVLHSLFRKTNENCDCVYRTSLRFASVGISCDIRRPSYPSVFTERSKEHRNSTDYVCVWTTLGRSRQEIGHHNDSTCTTIDHFLSMAGFKATPRDKEGRVLEKSGPRVLSLEAVDLPSSVELVADGIHSVVV